MQQLENILSSGDTYTSPEKEKPNLFTNASIKFFVTFIKIILNSSSLAKKGKYGNVEWALSSLKILRALENVGIEFEITGLKNLSSFEGPAVFIANHMSTLETNILPILIEPVKDATFVVKQELLNVPFFGNILKTRNPIVVGRSNPREDFVQVLSQGEKILKDGRSIIIFPQRTRSQFFIPESFNSLGIKLAKKTNAYVVPIALVTDAWGNGKLFKEFGKINPDKKVYFSFGTPIKINSNGSNEHLMVVDFIKSKLIEWDRFDCLANSYKK
jgi:1-acyl-sn-glycerol-3-phosphate acyltransferase